MDSVRETVHQILELMNFVSASARVFSSATSFSAAENQTGVGTVAATSIVNGDALTFSIRGGLDQSLFGINATYSVYWLSIVAPDYEKCGRLMEAAILFNVTMRVSDGSLTAAQKSKHYGGGMLNETPAEQLPRYSVSVTSFSAAENQTGVGM